MLARLINGLCAAAGAGAMAQFPAFYTQYLQHISGRLGQARADLAPVRQDAQQRGLEIAEYLERASREGGDLTATLVAGYRDAFESLTRLEQSYAALSAADPLTRPVALARHLHLEAARGTLADFAPALPLSAEGFVYAGVGLIAGLGLAWALERPYAVWCRRRARRRDTRDQQEAT